MLAESEGDYAQARSTKEFDEILAEVASLLGEPEVQRIEEEVLEDEKRVLEKLLAEAKPEEAKGKTCWKESSRQGLPAQGLRINARSGKSKAPKKKGKGRLHHRQG